MISVMCLLLFAAIPSVNETEIVVEVDLENDKAMLTWTVNHPESFTHIVVEACETSETDIVCLKQNVTDKSGTTEMDIPDGDNYAFSFSFYDGEDLVAEQREAITHSPSTSRC